MYFKKKKKEKRAARKKQANIDLEINEFLLIKRQVSLRRNDYINEKKY